MSTCQVKGCSNFSASIGLCDAHYKLADDEGLLRSSSLKRIGVVQVLNNAHTVGDREGWSLRDALRNVLWATRPPVPGTVPDGLSAPLPSTSLVDHLRADPAATWAALGSLMIAGPWVPIGAGWTRPLCGGGITAMSIIFGRDADGSARWRTKWAQEVKAVSPPELPTRSARDTSGLDYLKLVDDILTAQGWVVVRTVIEDGEAE